MIRRKNDDEEKKIEVPNKNKTPVSLKRKEFGDNVLSNETVYIFT